MATLSLTLENKRNGTLSDRLLAYFLKHSECESASKKKPRLYKRRVSFVHALCPVLVKCAGVNVVKDGKRRFSLLDRV